MKRCRFNKGDLIQGDCLKVLKKFKDDTIDTIITDPPYGLKFMGKKWDYEIPSIEVFEEMLRVAKPGAFLLCFGGTRTFHRMACNIEDAGWQIRDTMMWLTGQGFPKGHNWPLKLHEKACYWCGNMVKYDHEKAQFDSRTIKMSKSQAKGKVQTFKHTMRFVRGTYLQTPIYACAKCGQVLQPFMPKQGASEYRQAWAKSEVVWPEQSSMEGRSNLETSKGKLLRCEVCTLSGRPVADGAEGWLHCRTSDGNGNPPWATLEADGSCSSYRPQSIKQFCRQPDVISVERQAQKSRGWNVALKPAFEPIIVAMKPTEGTFVDNALNWGVAGLNIDGGRVGVTNNNPNKGENDTSMGGFQDNYVNGSKKGKLIKHHGVCSGRWPANVILTHHPDCKMVGVGKIKTGKSDGTIVRKGHSKNVCMSGGNYPHTALRYGEETIEKWDCHPDCPIRLLDEQSGVLKSGGGILNKSGSYKNGRTMNVSSTPGNNNCYEPNSGGASRFFYCAKASKSERNNFDADYFVLKKNVTVDKIKKIEQLLYNV